MNKLFIAILLAGPVALSLGCGRAETSIVDSGRDTDQIQTEEEQREIVEQTARDLAPID